MRKLLILLLLFSFTSLHAQTMLVELFYNINGISHSALCVFNGSSGKCKVLSNVGSCLFDAYYKDYGSYSTITTANPSVNGWIPATCYFTQTGNYISVQGYKFGLSANLVPKGSWNTKKAQYGFKLDSTSFKGKGKCRHALCSCSRYVSAGTGGKCVCGHWDYIHD